MTLRPLRDQWPHSANGPFSVGGDQKGPVPSAVPLQGPRHKKTSTRRPIKSPALHLKAINIPVRPARFLWAWQVWARPWGLCWATGDWLTVYSVRAWEIGGGWWWWQGGGGVPVSEWSCLTHHWLQIGGNSLGRFLSYLFPLPLLFSFFVFLFLSFSESLSPLTFLSSHLSLFFHFIDFICTVPFFFLSIIPTLYLKVI